MKTTLRKSLPASITLAGLACALSAALLVIHDRLAAASICILAGNVLDGLDGGLARRLNVASALGLQLDSLADVVTFGVAPSLLVYQYLWGLALSPVLVGMVCVGYLIGGALRLARFNLLPAKSSQSDSVGLTISVSGAAVALSVLVNHTNGDKLLPVAFFPVLLVVLTVLMVSRIRYPELGTVMRSRWLGAAWVGILVVLAVWLSPQLAGLTLVFGYVAFGLLRSAYRLAR